MYRKDVLERICYMFRKGDTKPNFAKLAREMGCSPDNSACEGFFGTIKNEMFHNTGAASMKVKEFIPYLEEYLRWFREERLKESLGFKSPIANRKALGIRY